jgi:hypothetical protein
MVYTESKRELERRDWLQAGERLKDLEEDYQAAKGAGTLTEELTKRLTETRYAYRKRGEETGKRRGLVAITTIWWRNWLEGGVEHELTARVAFRKLLADGGNTGSLLADFRDSLVAICSAAFAIESLYGDFVYRLPAKDWKKQPTQIQRLGYAFTTGWTLDQPEASRLVNQIDRLLSLRGDAVHAYTETLPARPHPAGLNTGAEHQLFNAKTAEEALDLAIQVVELAREPSSGIPPPYDRWMRRWAASREPYFAQIRELQAIRDRELLD